MAIELIKKFIFHFQKDALYRNSIYIMASTFVLAAFGFFFWMIVTRVASPNDVGLATTLISVMSLIGGFCTLSLNISLMRYLPTSKIRSDMINSVFFVTAIATVIVTIVFIAGLKTFSPHLLFLRANILSVVLFIVLLVAYTWNLIMDGIFMAYRATENILIKSSFVSVVKLILPLLLIGFGAFGIFSAAAIATMLGVVFGFFILSRRFQFAPKIALRIEPLSHMARFSVVNYATVFLNQLPTLLLPLLIVNFIDVKSAAFYYIDAMIFNLLLVIPIAATQSLLAEGSYDEADLQTHLKKSFGLIYGLLVPAILVIYFFGNIVLFFFGKNYEASSFSLLKLLAVSALFAAVPLIGNAVLRIKKQISLLLVCNFVCCIVLLAFSYIFIHRGLIGIGWGWLFGQVMSGLLFIILLWRELSKAKQIRPAEIESMQAISHV